MVGAALPLEILLYWIIINILFLFSCLVFAHYWNKSYNNKEYKKATVFAFLTFHPILLYIGFSAYYYIEFQNRQESLQSWSKRAIPADGGVKSIRIRAKHDTSLGQELIAMGLIDYAVFDSITLKPKRSTDCIRFNIAHSEKMNEMNALKAKNAFLVCSVESETRPQQAPPIWLYFGNDAPSRDKNCSRSSRTTVELRWASDKGGELIDFDEVPYRRKISGFWLVLLDWRLFWTECVRHGRAKNYSRLSSSRIDALEFIFSNLKDNIRKPEETKISKEDALEAIKYIKETEKTSNKNSIIQILGQWPSSREISQYIRSSVWDERFIDRVLSYSREEKLREKVLPHLHTHIGDFKAAREEASK